MNSIKSSYKIFLLYVLEITILHYIDEFRLRRIKKIINNSYTVYQLDRCCNIINNIIEEGFIIDSKHYIFNQNLHNERMLYIRKSKIQKMKNLI